MKEIELTRGLTARVSDEDYDRLSQYSWYACQRNKKFYACTSLTVNGRQKGASMHRMILNAAPGTFVDHIDRDTLNNTRENLRPASNAQNCWNQVRPRGKSGYVGVRQHHNKWVATIRHFKATIYVGSFATKEEAARARDRAAVSLRGEFARLNFQTQG